MKEYEISNFKIVKDIKEANCITHSGKFHTDEVFATIILSKVLENVNLIRVNKFTENPNNAIVYDIGGGEFDHHQIGGNGERENGVKYASCGLIWQSFGKKVLEKYKLSSEQIQDLFFRIDTDLIQYVDAYDNGQTKSISTDYRFIELGDIISTFNPNWNEQIDTDECFTQVVNFANQYFEHFLKREISKIQAKDMVESAIENSKDGILILEQFLPWKEFVLTSNNPKANELMFTIFPSNRGGYSVNVIPKDTQFLENRKNFPKEWAGLTDEKLQKVTGIETATFCHTGLFICSAKTKEDAIKLAKLVINNKENGGN